MNLDHLSQPGQEKLKACFLEDQRLQEIVGLRTISDLNAAISAGFATHIINIAEAIQERKMAHVADEIKASGRRIILLAGPSSSGKTTTSKRIALQLGASGIRPLVLSMDDYFLDREFTPRDAKGDYDYECIDALNISLFNEHLLALLDGKEVELPRYDFKTGHSQPSGQRLKCEPNDVLIIEGIHALNPALTPAIPRELKFQVYVSALTTIQMDDHRYVSTTDNRLIRRIVRDYQFRSSTAQQTIQRWPSVRAGEEKWIFPHQENCDVMINSAYLYELSAIRNHVLPMLIEVPKNSPERDEAERLIDLLVFFKPIPDNQISPTSLLREFLGGSSFHY